MDNTCLEAKHMKTWGRAAQAASHYLPMKEQRREQDDQELEKAKAVLVAELVRLLEIAKQLDRELPVWKQVLYVQETQNMIAACGITQQEIDDYQGVVCELEVQESITEHRGGTRAAQAPPPIVRASPAHTKVSPRASCRGGRGWDGWWGCLRRPCST